MPAKLTAPLDYRPDYGNALVEHVEAAVDAHAGLSWAETHPAGSLDVGEELEAQEAAEELEQEADFAA